ncbi:tetratricopeptide repeat protein [Christiangramia sediminis]|uniref:Uncharacterized protein n=1 Tax=Christiangramia sediminis TaxID=2881336 RepID=A0A9X1LIF0_9FLAO|nr:tetratricopeptide repeat protein [Christiangramia sediminis]MCB7480897.1 hypothetical protein [Christiangramia sediminis]
MSAITKIKLGISLMLICFTTSLIAQNGAEDDMGTTLYDAYKDKGVKEVLKIYQQSNNNKEYEGMAEPLNVLAYRLMQEEEDLKSAEVLLKAQIEEYPDEANPYDSYSDLLLEMDKKEEARKYIEKSIAIAEKTNHEQNDLIIEAGKAKLAILDNKDKQMNFLVGNWDNETKVFQNGEEVNSSKSSNNISFDSSGSIMIVDHDTPGKKPCCKRVMVYNPVKDEFDVAFMRRDQPNGIYNSKMQLKEVEPDHFEMIEKYTNDNNEEVEVRHDIQKKSNEVEWITYNSKDSGWEKVRSMNLKKKG